MEGFNVSQGDPLSLCLFNFGAEVLSRGLNALLLGKKTVNFSRPSHCPVVSYLAFADDLVIFINGFKQSLQHLMGFLNQYESE